MDIHTVLPQSYEPYAKDPRYTWIAVSASHEHHELLEFQERKIKSQDPSRQNPSSDDPEAALCEKSESL
jgi:hypothetical protein